MVATVISEAIAGKNSSPVVDPVQGISAWKFRCQSLEAMIRFKPASYVLSATTRWDFQNFRRVP